MILRSLRWQLQVWHAALLVVVLAGFGVTACQLQRASRLREIDRELDSAALEVLRFVHDRDPARGRPELPPPRRPRLGSAGIYFAAWARDGSEIERSPEAPGTLRHPGQAGLSPDRRPRHVTHGVHRESWFRTPRGDVVVVGRSMASDLEGFRHFALGLAAAGLAVLVAALATGAALAGRAMRPLERIGESARRIAAGAHSERITTTGLPEELASLAGLLNEGFDQIEDTLARQRRFTADASHELRTPVSVLLTQTQATLAHARSEAEYRATLEACQRAADRMRRLVESMLVLARLDSGEEPIRREPADLNAVAAEAIESVLPLARAHGIPLGFHPAPGPVEATVDEVQVGQVLLNLLGNAIAYNRAGGSVEVTTGRLETGLFVRVSDTGIGIAPDHLPRLFDRFYRVDGSRTNPRGHAGLGLAISSKILQHHGGRITVESEPGKGSVFTAWFPVTAPREEPSREDRRGVSG